MVTSPDGKAGLRAIEGRPDAVDREAQDHETTSADKADSAMPSAAAPTPELAATPEAAAPGSDRPEADADQPDADSDTPAAGPVRRRALEAPDDDDEDEELADDSADSAADDSVGSRRAARRAARAAEANANRQDDERDRQQQRRERRRANRADDNDTEADTSGKNDSHDDAQPGDTRRARNGQRKEQNAGPAEVDPSADRIVGLADAKAARERRRAARDGGTNEKGSGDRGTGSRETGNREAGNREAGNRAPGNRGADRSKQVETAQRGATANGAAARDGGQETVSPTPAEPQPSSFAASMNYERTPRKEKSMRAATALLLILAAVIPLLLSFYYGYYASDRYVSVAQFSVQSAQPQFSDGDTIASATGVPSAAGMLGAFQDAFVVREFVHSQELVDRIHAELDLIRLFSKEEVDWWGRLPPDATREEMHSYWQYRVAADLDATTGLIKLTVSAYTAEESLALGEAILAACHDLVNRLSEQARDDALNFAQVEVDKALDRLKVARAAVTEYRKITGDIFPEASAEAQLALIAQLQAQVAAQKADLAAKGLGAAAPTRRAAEARIAAMEQQIADERSKLTASAPHPGIDLPISDVLAQYQALEVDRTFAEEFYMSSLGLLEGARKEAIRTQRYLAVFVHPGLAQEPLEPRRVWAVATVLACAVAAYVVIGIGYKTVREHMV